MSFKLHELVAPFEKKNEGETAYSWFCLWKEKRVTTSTAKPT